MNTIALDASARSNEQEKRSASKKKTQDRAAFDQALAQSLQELNEGKVYEIDLKNPEESLRRILKTVE